MDKLPQELIDKIIGSFVRPRLSSYPSELLACSYVNRSWRRPAQQGIFHYISLSTENLKKWDRNISPESEISSYVRRLVWITPPAKTCTRWPDPFLVKAGPSRFASFLNIETLRITELSLLSLDTAAIERIFNPISHSLRSLDTSHLTTNPEKLCFLVSVLPNLRYLQTPTVTMLEALGDDPGQDRRLSFDFTGRLTRFNGSSTQKFFRCIAGLHPRFESLEVSKIGVGTVDTFNLLLQSCSTTLTTLLITPPGGWMTERKSSWSRLSIANRIRTVAIDKMLPLDLSPCSNLHTLRVDPEMAKHTLFNALLQTISSKHFEELVINGRGGPPHKVANDKVLRSFAERLRKLGVVKPLTMVLEYHPVREGGGDETVDIQSIWPLFCQVAIIVKDYDGWRRWYV